MGRHSARPDKGSRQGRNDDLLRGDSSPSGGLRRSATPDSRIEDQPRRRAAQKVYAAPSRRPAGHGRNIPASGLGAASGKSAAESSRHDGDFDYKVSSPRSRRQGALENAPAGLRAEIDRKKHNRKRIAIWIAIALGALVLATAVFGFFYLRNMQSSMQQNMNTGEKLELDLAKAGPQEPYNLLIMGYDRRPGETQYRSDTMLLARVDPVQQKVWLISLPRDYKVQIPGEGTAKLNAAYSLGQEELAIETIEKLTGQTINHYMGVTFDAFAAVVDAMGGVEIDVPEKIDDWEADYTADRSATVVDAGPQLLDGKHALTFVRSRDYPTGDFQRMINQQTFFRAMADQVAENVTVAELPGMVTKVVPHLKTDMSLLDLLRTARDLKGAGSANIYTTTLPGKWVSPYIIPDEAGKADILAKFEAGQPFVDAVAEEEVTTDPSLVTVTVRNGTTKAGVAKQAAAILEARGFNVVEVGNTQNQTVYDVTTLVYKDDEAALGLVAKYLPATVKQVQSKGMYTYDSEIMLVIGKDWDITKLPVAEVRSE